MQALVLIYHLSITYKTYKTYSTIQNINNINMSSTSTSTTSLDTYNSTHTMNYHHHYQPTNNELIQQAVPTEVKKLVSLTWQMVSCLCCNICVLQNSWLIVAVVLLLLLMLLILLMFLLLLMMFYCCWCFCCFCCCCWCCRCCCCDCCHLATTCTCDPLTTTRLKRSVLIRTFCCCC